MTATGTQAGLIIGPGYDYAFKFTFANGDYYTGYLKAFSGSLYQVDQSWTKEDEHGQLGTYKITNKTDNEMSSLNDGNVWVDNYYDAETKHLFSPVNGYAGSNFLGNEIAYIIKDGVSELKFGQGYYEADVAGNWYPYESPSAEYSAAWWQWMMKEPQSTNPGYDPTGKNAGLNQAGPFWYLAGSYVGTVTRTINLPSINLYFFRW